MHLCPAELRRRYNEERVVPFIGAGVSMSVTWTDADGNEARGPSWRELVNQAARLLEFEDPDLARVRGTDMQILEYFKIKNGQETARLRNWLLRSMVPPAAALQNSAILRELAKLDKCRLFYTTNFDDFIERAFELHGRQREVIAVERDMTGQRRDCEIVKFHGDLDHPEQIVLTESDYEKRLSLSETMDYRLRADLLGRVLLFIGYSFRDPNVSYLFRLFTDEFFGKRGSLEGPRAYIVVPDPSDFERELFTARHIEVIPVSGVSIAKDVVTLLKEMRS